MAPISILLAGQIRADWTFKLLVANLAADGGDCAGQEMP